MRTPLLALLVLATIAVPVGAFALQESSPSPQADPAPADTDAVRANSATTTSAIRIVVEHEGEAMTATLSLSTATGTLIAERVVTLEDGRAETLTAKVEPGKYVARFDWGAPGVLPGTHVGMSGTSQLDTTKCAQGGAAAAVSTSHHTTMLLLPSYSMTVHKAQCFDASSP